MTDSHPLNVELVFGADHARRLDETRRRLLAVSHAQTSVSDVALDYGFCHLGRFSADYRKAFGELPSETLRH